MSINDPGDLSGTEHTSAAHQVDAQSGSSRSQKSTDRAAHVKTNPIPENASVMVCACTTTTAHVTISAVGATTMGTNPILGINSLPAGTRHVVIEMHTTHSQGAQTTCDGFLASVNQTSIANYDTLFDGLTLAVAGAAMTAASDMAVKFAGKGNPVVEFHHGDADGDIEDVGFIGVDQSATAGTLYTYFNVYYW